MGLTEEVVDLAIISNPIIPSLPHILRIKLQITISKGWIKFNLILLIIYTILDLPPKILYSGIIREPTDAAKLLREVVMLE